MFKFVILAAAAIATAACANTATSSSSNAVEQPTIVGGWSATAITPDVTAAAEFAKAQIAAPDVTILSLGEVETQVVAGRNYRFTMSLSDGQFVKVAVWKKLDGSMELLSIARPVKD